MRRSRNARRAGLSAELSGLRSRRAAVEDELVSAESGEDAVPPVPYTRRTSPAAGARTGAPLWRVTDFAPHVTDDERAGIEAARHSGAEHVVTTRQRHDLEFLAGKGDAGHAPGLQPPRGAVNPVTQLGEFGGQHVALAHHFQRQAVGADQHPGHDAGLGSQHAQLHSCASSCRAAAWP